MAQPNINPFENNRNTLNRISEIEDILQKDSEAQSGDLQLDTLRDTLQPGKIRPSREELAEERFPRLTETEIGEISPGEFESRNIPSAPGKQRRAEKISRLRRQRREAKLGSTGSGIEGLAGLRNTLGLAKSSKGGGLKEALGIIKAEQDIKTSQRKELAEGMSPLSPETIDVFNSLPEEILSQLDLDKFKGESFIPDWQVINEKAFTSSAQSTESRNKILTQIDDSNALDGTINLVLDELAKIPEGRGQLPKTTLSAVGSKLKAAVTTAQLFAKDEGGFNLGVLNGPDLDVLEAILQNPVGVMAQAKTRENLESVYRRLKYTMMGVRDLKLKNRGIGTYYEIELPDGEVELVPSWNSMEIFREWAKEGRI